MHRMSDDALVGQRTTREGRKEREKGEGRRRPKQCAQVVSHSLWDAGVAGLYIGCACHVDPRHLIQSQVVWGYARRACEDVLQGQQGCTDCQRLVAG